MKSLIIIAVFALLFAGCAAIYRGGPVVKPLIPAMPKFSEDSVIALAAAQVDCGDIGVTPSYRDIMVIEGDGTKALWRLWATKDKVVMFVRYYSDESGEFHEGGVWVDINGDYDMDRYFATTAEIESHYESVCNFFKLYKEGKA